MSNQITLNQTNAHEVNEVQKDFVKYTSPADFGVEDDYARACSIVVEYIEDEKFVIALLSDEFKLIIKRIGQNLPHETARWTGRLRLYNIIVQKMGFESANPVDCHTLSAAYVQMVVGLRLSIIDKVREFITLINGDYSRIDRGRSYFISSLKRLGNLNGVKSGSLNVKQFKDLVFELVSGVISLNLTPRDRNKVQKYLTGLIGYTTSDNLNADQLDIALHFVVTEFQSRELTTIGMDVMNGDYRVGDYGIYGSGQHAKLLYLKDLVDYHVHSKILPPERVACAVRFKYGNCWLVGFLFEDWEDILKVFDGPIIKKEHLLGLLDEGFMMMNRVIYYYSTPLCWHLCLTCVDIDMCRSTSVMIFSKILDIYIDEIYYVDDHNVVNADFYDFTTNVVGETTVVGVDDDDFMQVDDDDTANDIVHGGYVGQFAAVSTFEIDGIKFSSAISFE